MSKINKILVISSVFTLVLFGLLVSKGYCVNPITTPFYPNQTYPAQTKDYHLDTSIVQPSGIASAIIVVDMDNPECLGWANSINTKIDELITSPATPVTLLIYDDNDPNIDFTKNIIAVGNYANNEFIRNYVYVTKKVFCDKSRPSEDGQFMINNVRVNNQGRTLFTNCIVLSGKASSEILSAVNYFKNTMLVQSVNAAHDTITLSSAVNYGNYWYGFSISDPGYELSFGSAGILANMYWLTGQEICAQEFRMALMGPDFNTHDHATFDSLGYRLEHVEQYLEYFNDNGRDLDFYLGPLINAWRNIERSPYFTSAAHSADRLYITKLLNYLSVEMYKFSSVHNAMEVYRNPQYPEPLGNHETDANAGIQICGLYFSDDGYNFNSPACPPAYNAVYPNNFASQWLEDARRCFEEVHSKMSVFDDDSGEYWFATPSVTRQYFFMKQQPAAEYFNNNPTNPLNGMFNNGVDRSVADFYILATPNITTKAGFGDCAGLQARDFDIHDLKFWAEQYSDGRYSWLFDKIDNNSWSGGHFNTPGELNGDTDSGKSICVFGLKDIPFQEPTDMLGVKKAPLEGWMYNFLNTYGGAYTNTYSHAVYGDQIGQAHLANPDEAFYKISFRGGWDVNDQYLLLDGTARLGHGHYDQLSITEFEDNGRIFLVDHSWGDREARGYQNALTIAKQSGASYVAADGLTSTAAGVKNLASFEKTGFAQAELPQYGNGSWSTDISRSILWRQEEFFLVLDEVVPHNSSSYGTYQATLNWKSLHDGASGTAFTGEGTNKITINQTGERCVIHTLPTTASYSRTPFPFTGNDTWGNGSYIYANPGTMSTLSASVTANLSTTSQKIIIPTLIYTYGTADPNYVFSQINSDTIYHLTATGENIYLGKALNTQTKTFANSTAKANLFYIEEGTYFALANGYLLTQQTPNIQLFISDIPISIEFDMVQQNGIINIAQSQGLATIGLYNPQNYPLYVDNLPAMNSGWLNGITTFNLETTEDGNSQHQFYFDDGGIQPNQPPYFVNPPGAQTVVVGNTVSFTINATDPESDPLTYSASNLPTGATFNTSTRVFSWTPTSTQVGSYTVNFSVTDNHNPPVPLAVPITVSAQAVNQPPYFVNPPGAQTVVVGNTLSFTLNAADPEGDPLTYSASNLPTGATFNTSTRAFSWTPTSTQVGSYTVNFSVTDNHNPPVPLAVPITVSATTPQGNNVALGKAYTCTTPNGEYPDSGGELTDGLYAPPSSRMVGWGGGGGNTQWSFWVKIDLGNPPVPINAATISAYGGDDPGYGGRIFPDSMDVYTATQDIESQYVFATRITNPIGNPGQMSTQVFTGNFNATARYVKIVFNCSGAQGGGNGYVTVDEIQVLAPATPTNHAPVIAYIPPTTVIVRETATVPVTVTDLDGDPITLTVTPMPGKADLVYNGNNSWTFTLRTTNGMVGNTYTFTATASDGQGGTDTEPIIINVINRQR